ncbi:hypothetical protein ONS95_011096 [Cadophora gregata]|uniref:uncharacterized protein n=1 Tax=Cadophora gregata TaxID=51156 RepID=UPI0026DA8942|nr:uncharacterized protein ONS95_011096 [Cadophora gregata]KAK0119659.1 hypothetical protein ONS95_011096 [Cadophora gregata]KAK0120694.1 hypothetical protein ONS96_010897 [Cadophora gregata f. sp. sojae]
MNTPKLSDACTVAGWRPRFDIKSLYPEFDWDMYPSGKWTLKNKGLYFVPSGSTEIFLFTAEGFWYSKKRFPRVQYPTVRDWPTEEPTHFFEFRFQFDVYFIGRDINVETGAIMRCGKHVKLSYNLRDRDLPHVLDKDGFIKRISWYDIPADVNLGNRPYKFVQTVGPRICSEAPFGHRTMESASKEESGSGGDLLMASPFRNRQGSEKLVETGLTKDGRTYVLVNKEIEAEMDEDKWWAENQNMLLLERRDGKIVPCQIKDPKFLIGPKFNRAVSEEDGEEKQDDEESRLMVSGIPSQLGPKIDEGVVLVHDKKQHFPKGC